MIRIPFEHSYADVLPQAGSRVSPAVAPAPHLLHWNATLADELGLAPGLDETTLAACFSGAAVPDGAQPFAQVYAGHQFGGYSPQLGDGRALLLGEVIDLKGQRRDIALKGSGRTPYSRRGDGKAAVGPMLRELIIGEAMQALGIPTTRALAVVATGETVYRDRPLPGAVLTRVAASHIRVGTFEYFANRGDDTTLRQLAAYTLQRHYPQLQGAANPYLAMLEAVCQRQAALVAQWLHAGFIHGVMNTDNMTLSGETIDYGPCAFMDAYDPATVFSSIDERGRYAYANQPAIAQWNLARLAETLLPLLDAVDADDAVQQATGVIHRFQDHYQQAWLAQARRKLGLASEQAGDQALADDWLTLLQQQQADFTLAWRYLADVLDGDGGVRLAALCHDGAALQPWLARWQQRLAADGLDAQSGARKLRAANPVYIARNHLVEEALSAASEYGDTTLLQSLLAVLADPYTEQPAYARYAQPASAELVRGYRTFCGT